MSRGASGCVQTRLLRVELFVLPWTWMSHVTCPGLGLLLLNKVGEKAARLAELPPCGPGHLGSHTVTLSILHAHVLIRVQTEQRQTFPSISLVGKPQETE